MKNTLSLLLLCFTLSIQAQDVIEKWKVFELNLSGPESGNPFTEVEFGATFKIQDSITSVDGFYDGEGHYLVRFMPGIEGEWTIRTHSNIKSLNGKKGKFQCIPPSKGNHGPVRIAKKYFFEYADGTPHHSFGTTVYGWIHQPDSLVDLTLESLRASCFNKVRLCIFPLTYHYNKSEPVLYPFEGKPPTDWDFTHFNPEFFRNLDRRIQQLDESGIEADIIVFHGYDKWDFSKMDSLSDERYIKYLIARLGAYKNVWWSMANEFEILKEKEMNDWDRFIDLFAEKDPYNHLRSIHNMGKVYDHHNPLITHVSYQGHQVWQAYDMRQEYEKPVIFDECAYEGNLPWGWGNITAKEMVNRFWLCFTSGGYAGHSETYIPETPAISPYESDEVIFWVKGGNLVGESPERIKFMREIIEEAPPYLSPVFIANEKSLPCKSVGYDDKYYLAYFKMEQPRVTMLNLPKSYQYEIEVIDTWEMTITKKTGIYSGKCFVELPGRPGIALRIKAIE